MQMQEKMEKQIDILWCECECGKLIGPGVVVNRKPLKITNSLIFYSCTDVSDLKHIESVSVFLVQWIALLTFFG